VNGLAPTAATWTEASGWHDLGLASIADNSSSLDAITPDRTVTVGTARVDATASYQVLRHTAAGAELLGDLPGGELFAAASAVSDDGAVLVGFGTSATGTEAPCLTSTSGLMALGGLAGGAVSSRADAITPEGTFIVGSSDSADGSEAVAWDHGAAIARMADVLAEGGVTVPTGWRLTQAHGVTVVGGAISVVGDATNAPGDHEGWLARSCP
jgi:uncharacterized membrane protein